MLFGGTELVIGAWALVIFPRASSPVAQKTYSHQVPSGLTLVAEEIDCLASAAFALLVPGGCGYARAARLGLGNLTCETSQRGAGQRDSWQFLGDLEKL